MEKNKYKVTLGLEVEGFDDGDCQIVIQDYLGVGSLDEYIKIKSIKIEKE